MAHCLARELFGCALNGGHCAISGAKVNWTSKVNFSQTVENAVSQPQSGTEKEIVLCKFGGKVRNGGKFILNGVDRIVHAHDSFAQHCAIHTEAAIVRARNAFKYLRRCLRGFRIQRDHHAPPIFFHDL